MTAGELAAVSTSGALTGAAKAHAAAMTAAALATLERLGDQGWRAVVGDEAASRGALGADAVAERTEPFDPLAAIERRRTDRSG